jgi:hypothetical protein
VNIVILNWQRLLWEGDQEVLKRSGRDEPIWVVIHMCLEAMIGISLYSYFYIKLEKKCYVFLIISYILSSIKSEKKRAEQVLPGSRGGEWVVGEVAEIMYIHVSKCKNDKIKFF